MDVPTQFPGVRLDATDLTCWFEFWLTQADEAPHRVSRSDAHALLIDVHCFSRDRDKRRVLALADMVRSILAHRTISIPGGESETGTTAEIFRAPAHPYTEGLLASIPRVDRIGERLRPIPGVVPPPHAWPAGCRFADRCPYVWERGRSEPPPLLELVPGRGDTRAARCWLVQEPERRTARVERAP